VSPSILYGFASPQMEVFSSIFICTAVADTRVEHGSGSVRFGYETYHPRKTAEGIIKPISDRVKQKIGRVAG